MYLLLLFRWTKYEEHQLENTQQEKKQPLGNSVEFLFVC